MLAMSTLLLTGCNQNISKDKFNELVQEGKGKVQEVTNVNFHNKLSATAYNYKEGEFYSYKMFALLLIVPITSNEITWKDEDGKYYHYKQDSLTSTKTSSEITDEQFAANMTAHKAKIVSELLNPLSKAELLMTENVEEYKSINNKFTKNGLKNQYTLKSTCKYEVRTNEVYDGDTLVSYDSEEKTDTFTIVLNKEGLPVTYTSKIDGSETKWTYNYGKAELNLPEDAKPAVA